MRKLPQEVHNLIDHYFNLQINGKVLKTPYHINVKHIRGELRSLVGKGSPQEIEEEVNIFAKLRNFNIKKANTKEVREFMEKEGIGIDCSGLVSHVLDTWLKSLKRGSLSSNITFPKVSFFKRIVLKIRPIENINTNLLTSKENSIEVDLKNVDVGDLIRLKGLKQGHHIAIITEIKKTNNQRKEITYTHSTKYYGEESGIKQGKIIILDENKPLEEQNWLEKDENGKCWTLKQYMKEKNDNGLRRPKFFVNSK